MARSLEEQLTGAEPEAWIPEEGDSIFGEIEAVVTRDGDYGEFPVITILDNDENVWNVAGFGTVLQNKIAELEPQVGDSIGFKFLGEKSSKNGKSTYKDWRVVLSRAPKNVAVPAAVAASAPATGDEFSEDE